MPSKKPSMIDSLRAKHDPHYQLAGKVESLEKGLPIQIAQLHKTMSKSFGMQRKTLTRVLGLEGRLSNLEGAVEAWTTREGMRRQGLETRLKELEKLEEEIEEITEEIEEIPPGLDELIDDVRTGKEVGGTKTKPKAKAKPKVKPKAKAKPKVKPKAKKTRVTGKRIRKPKIDSDKFRGTSQETAKEKLERQAEKIDADKFKRGTSQETAKEKLERQARNRQETAAGEEHKKSDEYTETTTGTDPKTGEPLSSAERKRRFKAAKFMNKTGLDPQGIKPETEAEMGDDSKKDKIVTFLNRDVKDNLDGIDGVVKEIAEAIKSQGDSAEERDEDMRQALLTGRKKKREDKLEGKDKKDGGLKEKLLKQATKPVGNFLNKLLRFVTVTFVGMVVNNILSILKNPWKILDPIKQFFNLIISTMNQVMKSMWNITGRPINLIIEGINKGLDSLFGMINNFTKNFGIPAIELPDIPLTQPFQFPLIPLADAKKETNEEESTAIGMAGGGLVPGPAGRDGKDGTSMFGYNEGGLVNRIQPEDLEIVNKERELQGLPPLDKLTYAKGVTPNVVKGPGERTQESIDEHTDLETMIRTITRTVNGKTTRESFKLSNEEASALLKEKGYPSMELRDGSIVVDRAKVGWDMSMKYINWAREQLTPEQLAEFDSRPDIKAMMEGIRSGSLEKDFKYAINRQQKGTEEHFLGEMGDDIAASAKKASGYSGGGVVPTPYPVNDNILGLSASYSGLPGFNKGGKVPGSGNSDTVPAMLTPGEFVMSKGAVNMIGADKLMAMNAAGGGTNVPKMMKFAGGGIVPDIPPPKRRGGGLIMAGGGGSGSSGGGGGSKGSGASTPAFSSVDQNNPNITVIKSIYNIMS